MTSIQGQMDRKKVTSVFGFWLAAGENIDFVTQHLANNRISGAKYTPGGGHSHMKSDVGVPPSTSDVGVFQWQIASKMGVFQ